MTDIITGQPREYVCITPEIGQRLLEEATQKKVRSLTKRNRIATDMREGRFNPLNGERLLFGRDGNKLRGGLEEGITRISALVITGSTYTFEISREHSQEDLETVDSNITPRTGRHLLMRNEVFSDLRACAPAETTLKLLTWVHDYDMDRSRYGNMPCSQQLTMEALRRFPAVEDAWNFVRDYPGLANVVMYPNAMLLYCVAVETGHVEEARDFLSGIANWVGLFEDCPCYQVRMRLSRETNDRHPRGSKATTMMARLSVMVRGWNEFFPSYDPQLGQNSGNMATPIPYNASHRMPTFSNLWRYMHRTGRTVNRRRQSGVVTLSEAAE